MPAQSSTMQSWSGSVSTGHMDGKAGKGSYARNPVMNQQNAEYDTHDREHFLDYMHSDQILQNFNATSDPRRERFVDSYGNTHWVPVPPSPTHSKPAQMHEQSQEVQECSQGNTESWGDTHAETLHPAEEANDTNPFAGMEYEHQQNYQHFYVAPHPPRQGANNNTGYSYKGKAQGKGKSRAEGAAPYTFPREEKSGTKGKGKGKSSGQGKGYQSWTNTSNANPNNVSWKCYGNDCGMTNAGYKTRCNCGRIKWIPTIKSKLDAALGYPEFKKDADTLGEPKRLPQIRFKANMLAKELRQAEMDPRYSSINQEIAKYLDRDSEADFRPQAIYQLLTSQKNIHLTLLGSPKEAEALHSSAEYLLEGLDGVHTKMGAEFQRRKDVLVEERDQLTAMKISSLQDIERRQEEDLDRQIQRMKQQDAKDLQHSSDDHDK